MVQQRSPHKSPPPPPFRAGQGGVVLGRELHSDVGWAWPGRGSGASSTPKPGRQPGVPSLGEACGLPTQDAAGLERPYLLLQVWNGCGDVTGTGDGQEGGP